MDLAGAGCSLLKTSPGKASVLEGSQGRVSQAPTSVEKRLTLPMSRQICSSSCGWASGWGHSRGAEQRQAARCPVVTTQTHPHTHDRTPIPQPEATAPQPPSPIAYLLTTAKRNRPESGLSQPAWEVRPLAWVEYLLSAMWRVPGGGMFGGA